MRFFSKLLGKVQEFFTPNDRAEAAKLWLYTFGLNDKHIRFVLREVLEMRDAEMSGSEKRDNIVGIIKSAHDEALTFDGGLKWPPAALEMLENIVQIVYILAKITRKI